MNVKDLFRRKHKVTIEIEMLLPEGYDNAYDEAWDRVAKALEKQGVISSRLDIWDIDVETLEGE